MLKIYAVQNKYHTQSLINVTRTIVNLTAMQFIVTLIRIKINFLILKKICFGFKIFILSL